MKKLNVEVFGKKLPTDKQVELKMQLLRYATVLANKFFVKNKMFTQEFRRQIAIEAVGEIFSGTYLNIRKYRRLKKSILRRMTEYRTKNKKYSCYLNMRSLAEKMSDRRQKMLVSALKESLSLRQQALLSELLNKAKLPKYKDLAKKYGIGCSMLSREYVTISKAFYKHLTND